MLSKLIKISLVFILLPECLLGQKIYTSIERVNGSALETSRFYVSKRDANGNDIIKTEAIFSQCPRIGNDNGFEHVVASIETGEYISAGKVSYNSAIWLCMNDNLQIMFYYPVQTAFALPFDDGISLFAVRGEGILIPLEGTSGYDGFGAMGAVDMAGDVVVQPRYDFITKSGSFVNAVRIHNNGTESYIMECDVTCLNDRGADYSFVVRFDDKMTRDEAMHSEFAEIIRKKDFNRMISNIEYDYDTLMYLKGVHYMLNLNFRDAMESFRQVSESSPYESSKYNISQCVELYLRMPSMTTVL